MYVGSDSEGLWTRPPVLEGYVGSDSEGLRTRPPILGGYVGLGSEGLLYRHPKPGGDIEIGTPEMRFREEKESTSDALSDPMIVSSTTCVRCDGRFVLDINVFPQCTS